MLKYQKPVITDFDLDGQKLAIMRAALQSFRDQVETGELEDEYVRISTDDGDYGRPTIDDIDEIMGLVETA